MPVSLFQLLQTHRLQQKSCWCEFINLSFHIRDNYIMTMTSNLTYATPPLVIRWNWYPDCAHLWRYPETGWGWERVCTWFSCSLNFVSPRSFSSRHAPSRSCVSCLDQVKEFSDLPSRNLNMVCIGREVLVRDRGPA